MDSGLLLFLVFGGSIYLSWVLMWRYLNIKVEGEKSYKGQGAGIMWGTFFGSNFFAGGLLSNDGFLFFTGVFVLALVAFAFLRRCQSANMR